MSGGYTRIRGQEVTVGFVYNGALITLAECLSSEFSVNTKILEEGYLGQSVNQYDDILEGFSGKLTFHLSSEEALVVANAMASRAQSRDPSIKFSVNFRASFPNGQTPRVMLTDCFFDATSFNVPKRDEYVNVEFNFKTSNFTLLP